MKKRMSVSGVLGVVLLCANFSFAAGDEASFDEASFKKAQEILKSAAETARQKYANLSFEEFKAKVYKEPFEGGKYIVNGDTPIRNEKLLREFYERSVKNKPPSLEPGISEFIVHQVGGLDAVWSNTHKRALTYCVSDNFGSRYTRVMAAMEAATSAWEAVADIDFIHLTGEDSRCTDSNTSVVFDVRPVQVFGQYLARAFFPNEPRSQRNILIDASSFTLDPNGKLQLVGILRHELGHTIGARHEHTRPESGTCFEDDDWRPLTNYDPFSVMHYPQCNGLGDWSLHLTDKDKNGVACLYGAASGFVVDPSICVSLNRGQAKTVLFKDQSVARGEQKRAYGPFSVQPGTSFTAIMEGVGASPGDPDLYVKFDGSPQLIDYDCRPYSSGADETCSVDVPAGKSRAGVMVHGYRNGHYKLTVTYTEP